MEALLRDHELGARLREPLEARRVRAAEVDHARGRRRVEALRTVATSTAFSGGSLATASSTHGSSVATRSGSALAAAAASERIASSRGLRRTLRLLRSRAGARGELGMQRAEALFALGVELLAAVAVEEDREEGRGARLFAQLEEEHAAPRARVHASTLVR